MVTQAIDYDMHLNQVLESTYPKCLGRSIVYDVQMDMLIRLICESVLLFNLW